MKDQQFEELKSKFEELKSKYRDEFGDTGMRFMQFVLQQHLQIELLKAAVNAANENETEILDVIFDGFSRVHSNMTESYAATLDLSVEVAEKIFDAAGEAFEIIKPDVLNREGKTND